MEKEGAQSQAEYEAKANKFKENQKLKWKGHEDELARYQEIQKEKKALLGTRIIDEGSGGNVFSKSWWTDEHKIISENTREDENRRRAEEAAQKFDENTTSGKLADSPEQRAAFIKKRMEQFKEEDQKKIAELNKEAAAIRASVPSIKKTNRTSESQQQSPPPMSDIDRIVAAYGARGQRINEDLKKKVQGHLDSGEMTANDYLYHAQTGKLSERQNKRQT